MPIINPSYFYLMDVADSFKTLSVVLLLTILLLGLFAALSFLMSNDLEDIQWKLVKKYLIFPCLVLMIIVIFTPSSSTLTKMIIAENITVENYEIAKGEVTELIDYIFDKINNKGETE